MKNWRKNNGQIVEGGFLAKWPNGAEILAHVYLHLWRKIRGLLRASILPSQACVLRGMLIRWAPPRLDACLLPALCRLGPHCAGSTVGSVCAVRKSVKMVLDRLPAEIVKNCVSCVVCPAYRERCKKAEQDEIRPPAK